MSLYALTNASNVIQRLVEWDGNDSSQFGALTATAIDPALDPIPGDTYVGSVLTRGVPLDQQNRQVILSRARTALAANNTFLAIASPNAAQTLAQVQRLTKESTALIKLALGLLDDTTGT